VVPASRRITRWPVSSAPPPPKKKRGCLPIAAAVIGVLILIGIVAAVAGGGGDDEPERVGRAADEQEGGNEGQSSSDDGASQNFAVGDVVELGDFQLTVHGVTNPQPPGEFIQPAAGNRFVGVDLEVRNTTDEPQSFSILLAVEAQDEANRVYNVALGATEGAPPDGDLQPQSSKRGAVAFEVPDAVTSLRLNFNPEVFGTGQATVQLF
jgi:hypothetical protein